MEGLLRMIVGPVGHDFCETYKYPLLAFLSLPENSEETHSIVARGLSNATLRAGLEEILRHDIHLLKCCGDVEHLAMAIDTLFLRRLNQSHFPDSITGFGFVTDRLEAPLIELDQVLYEQGEFEKQAFFHLFNVSFQPEVCLQSPYYGWDIREVEPTTVPRLLGESSFHSFISPPLCGTWFLVCRDRNGFETETLYDWLARRWKEAQPFRQSLQYSVDGIVDIDYVCPYFSPSWVNEIHKGGLYFLGLPRQHALNPSFRCSMDPIQQEQVNRVWRTYLRYQARIGETGPTLRKAIRIAGEFFEDYHRKGSRVEQFASLMIALEALFTPSDQAEQTFRISQSCALLSSEPSDSIGRQQVYEFLRVMFIRRGKLFHGRFDVSEEAPDQLASDEEIQKLASLVRKSILRLLAMYLRGENSLDTLRKNLQKAALDEALRDELFRKGDFEALVDDSQTSLLPILGETPPASTPDLNPVSFLHPVLPPKS